MTRLIVGLSLLLAAALAAPAVAATDPTAQCTAARLKAAGKEIAAVLKCHAKAAKAGTAVDAVCVTKARDKAAEKLAKATAAGGCLASLYDDAEHAAHIAARAAVIGRSLLPGAGDSACQSTKVGAEGKSAQAMATAAADCAK